MLAIAPLKPTMSCFLEKKRQRTSHQCTEQDGERENKKDEGEEQIPKSEEDRDSTDDREICIQASDNETEEDREGPEKTSGY